MNHKPKLELTWIGKDKQPKLEPRILIEDPEKSYGDKNTENMLIYGDNLLALKALEQDFAGKIKCAAIDPPYNTGSAFEQYEDNLEHSIWLSLMKPRLEIIRNLLSEEGSLWVNIDDNEGHYLKVMLDEIFSRKNFVSTVVWQKVFAKKNKALISGSHDMILVYAKNIDQWNRNLLPRNDIQKKAFKNPDKDPRGLWQSVAYSVQSEDSERRTAYRYPIKLPSGKFCNPPEGRHWNGLPDRTEELRKDNRLWFGPNGDNPPRIKVFISEVQEGIVPDTWWSHSEFGNNQEAKKEILNLFEGIEPFPTPKPEKLISQIFTIASNEGDWTLDSFLGSGTSSAVAQKMNRKWIGIELGEHCHTHCLPRLHKVCDGTDQGGISKSVEWKGGGGFKYYYLAPSLLKQDKYNNWVINPEYNGNMLASAMAKHEGFRYQPDEQIYWKQGQSTEKDFIYTTTQFITVETLDRIHEEMQNGESLLICCKSFSKACEDRYSNITIKKIPKMLLGRCEFGKEDYSLNIINMPVDPNEPDFIPKGFNSIPSSKKKKNGKTEPNLFNSENGGEE